MKRIVMLLALCAAAALVVAIAIARTGARAARPVAPPPGVIASRSAAVASVPRVWDVDELMKQADAAPPSLRVRGVVSSVDSAKKRFGLIDLAEFRSCGVRSCASLTLPVDWKGALPAVRDSVEIEGNVDRSGGKQYFAASAMKILPAEESAEQ